jgi:hypothetical protein
LSQALPSENCWRDETSDTDHDWTAKGRFLQLGVGYHVFGHICILEGKIPKKPGAVETGHADGRFQRALQECSTPLGRKLHSSQLANNNQLWESLIGQQLFIFDFPIGF